MRSMLQSFPDLQNQILVYSQSSYRIWGFRACRYVIHEGKPLYMFDQLACTLMTMETRRDTVMLSLLLALNADGGTVFFG